MCSHRILRFLNGNDSFSGRPERVGKSSGVESVFLTTLSESPLVSFGGLLLVASASSSSSSSPSTLREEEPQAMSLSNKRIEVGGVDDKGSCKDDVNRTGFVAAEQRREGLADLAKAIGFR